MDVNTTFPKKILISGGSGLIGSFLVNALKERGHDVAILSREPYAVENVKSYYWDAKKQLIDKECLEKVDTIIHLAGANIGDKPWTDERKKLIIDSRVKTIEFLYKAIKETGAPVKNVISPSAVGFYGDRGNEWIIESDKNGEGFLATCCRQWEDAVWKGIELNSRIVIFRVGILLTKKGGALPKLARPIKWFAGAPLGSGKQWIPWIHYKDLVAAFVSAVEDDTYNGIYNLCAPHPVTNKQFTKALAQTLHRPVWPFRVPASFLKLLLGEMSEAVLMSSRVLSEKLQHQGFDFQFKQPGQALNDLYHHE